MLGTLHHYGITTEAIDESIELFGALGFEVHTDTEASGADLERGLAVPGAALRLVLMSRPGEDFNLELLGFTGGAGAGRRARINEPGASHLGVLVEDIDAALEAVETTGARRTGPVGRNEDVGLAWAYVAGREGSLIELLQPIERRA